MNTEERQPDEVLAERAREYLRNALPPETLANVYPDKDSFEQDVESHAEFAQSILEEREKR